MVAWGKGKAPETPNEAARRSAREMAREALDLMHAERWEEASELLAKAHDLVPAPTLSLLEGRALEKQGKLVEARTRFESSAHYELESDSPEAYQRAVSEAKVELKALTPRIPKLKIVLKGDSLDKSAVRVRLDNEIVSTLDLSHLSVNPGEHVVAAGTGEGRVTEERVRVVEGDSLIVVLHVPEPSRAANSEEMEPMPAPLADEGSTRPWGWVLLGVGAAGIGVGVVSGAMMLDARNDLESGCNAACPKELAPTLSRFRTTRTVSAIGYVSGVLGLATGAGILVLSPPKDPQQTGWKVWSNARVVGVEGSF